ncbi:MAG: hypothetical protein IKQ92_03360 [Clostridia bacterium]|nr:hypothetical protein [Clostridia bacterium]
MEDKTKLAETLKSVWSSLTDEQKAKAAECKTMDELLKVAGEECIELPDEVLEAAAGGYIYRSFEKRGNDTERRWWWQVIDDKTGDVLGTYSPDLTREEMREIAKQHGQSTTELPDSCLELLRTTGSIYSSC